MQRLVKSIIPIFFLLLSLLSSSLTWAIGGSEVFSRLLRLLTLEASESAASHVLRQSPEIRELARRVLGAEAQILPENQLVEAALRRLMRQGNIRFAESLEARLLSIESDLASEMARTPGGSMDVVLGRLSASRLAPRDARSLQQLEDRLSTQRFNQVRANEPPALRGNPNPQLSSSRPISEEERAWSAERLTPVELDRLVAQARQIAPLHPELQISELLSQYERLCRDSNLVEYFPRNWVYRQLAEEEMTYYTLVMKDFFTSFSSAPARMSTEQRVNFALRRVLRGRVPASTISERIRALHAQEPNSFRRALGDMTFEETQILYHGGNPQDPTPESLIGQYLRETGASTVLRTFDDAAAVEAGRPGAQGPTRLVISLSGESFPVFSRLFGRLDWMTAFGHGGILHELSVFPHYGLAAPLRGDLSGFTPIPMVLLKTTEGSRLKQFLRLFMRDNAGAQWSSAADMPWRLQGYCAASAWGGCTQRIGNMPIGDERVIELALPGDRPGRNALNPAPNVQRLGSYESNDPLIRRVWKIPANRPFGEVIGQRDAYLRGELANPGWVMSTLLGPTSIERVPVVFVARPDHRAPLPANFVPKHERRF